MISHLEIKIVAYTEAIESIKNIRYQVFQIEQAVAAELEFDGLDESAIHLLAYFDNKPIGTARIRQIDPETAKIERLAVLSDVRGLGIGTTLMETALELISRNKNTQKVVVNAQVYIKSLYKNLGFQAVGTPFDEAGIQHIKMIKNLKSHALNEG
ncbi:GNAT family N-acetyltransferase [Chroococcus sp. FPU101]|uniref:GNAT family N-acetyltransferase n=1 Tax=Chroococcus sp. FPU101 TaxID=1974212 RepID=UPI001AA65B36|nr:GNAT family N-acetyltransferase [Chroococcus sp. FPU101]GFE69740.1 hypothetical protein CFPU101_23500 [Chroococcus sp. FPU101]